MTALAFWGAVVLPVFYLPVFVIGLGDPLEFGAFLALVVVHLLALVGGRNHRRDADGAR